MESAVDGKWILGLNSLLDPSLLKQGEYAWGLNIDNVGGIIQTRQGFNAVGVKDNPLPTGEPKGIAAFKGKDGITKLIIAIGNNLWAVSFPIVKDFVRIGTGFHSNDPVVFCNTLQSVALQADGTLKVLDSPIPYLVMTNGVERAKIWDGFKLTTINPAGTHGHPQIPIGKWTQWSGNRLWISNGRKLMASDFGNPLSFFEATYISGGGALYLDDEITGITQTTDLQNLLVCSDFDTTAVQSNVFDRTTWGSTPGFQRVIFPGVGCVAGKSFVKQWGVIWWMSNGGWVGIDQALVTYQRSRIQYRDQQMMRAKERLNGDKSGITASKFGNYLVISVPFASRYNAGTWVLNQRVLDFSAPTPLMDASDPAAWAAQWTGIQPVDYANCVIDGQERLFALSRHVGLNGRALPVVWELFTGERQDRYNDLIFRPPCIFETRVLGFSEELKKFRFAEVDVSELLGIIDLQVFAAGRKGNYRKLMDKQIVASPGSVNASITSPFLTTVTDDVPEGAAQIPVASTAGSLPAPALVEIEGRAITYIDKNDTAFIIDPSRVPVPNPTFNPPPDSYDVDNLFVRILCPFPGVNLCYTTDGSDPSRTHGTIVASNAVGLVLNGGTTTLKALAFLPDQPLRDSGITSGDYTVAGIHVPGEPPVPPDPSIRRIDLPPITFNFPPPIVRGAQVTQPQFEFPNNPTILTSYVPQRRMLRTEEWDVNKFPCSTCDVESKFTDDTDRGFSLLFSWQGRLAINGMRIMTEKAPEEDHGRCEEDEITSRSVDQGGCGKSSGVQEWPTIDSAPRQSQYLRSITSRPFNETAYNPVP